MRTPRLALAALAATAAAVAHTTPAAQADTALAAVGTGLELRADAGRVAWLRPDGAGFSRFVTAAVADPQPTDAGPRLRRAVRFDVGRGRDGAATIVWAEGCSARAGRCTVRALPAAGGPGARARVLTRIPYAGGGVPEVALDGRRLVYTREVRDGRRRCDTLNVRTLTGGAVPARPRQLVLGTGCVPVLQLDVEGRWVAALVVPNDTTPTNGQPTEVLAVRADGSGRARSLERETEGEESNYVDALAIDGGRVYTARAGIRQANAILRFDPATGARSQALVFGQLAGGFARDRGHGFLVQSAVGAYGQGCPELDGPDCLLVAQDDPWAGRRSLLPRLTLPAAPAPLYADQDLVLGGSVTRRTASRTARGPAVGVAGVPVRLASATLTDEGRASFAPTGLEATTAADGRWSVTVPAPQVNRRGFDAQTDVLGVLGADTLFPVVYTRMDVTSATRAGGRVTLSGALSPPQPGRRVVLERRVSRDCDRPGFTPFGPPTPSTVGQPAGCVDRFRGLGSAAVSADGASFTISRTVAAGTFKATLDPPAAAGGGLAGETAQVRVR